MKRKLGKKEKERINIKLRKKNCLITPVFPEPVSAAAITSPPPRINGIASA
jgi:hypothetical protein